MNRREFCLTAGLLATAPLLGGLCHRAASAIIQRNNPISFRAKKVYLDSWPAETIRRDSLHAASFVQNQLNAVRRDGCNGLILVPGRHFITEWLKRIETEANRSGLAVLVPTRLTRGFLRDAKTVVPLVHENGTFLSDDGVAADDGGLLLLSEPGKVFGLVLYDASRCLWTGYALSGAGQTRDAEWHDRDAELTAARWLDHTRKTFSRPG